MENNLITLAIHTYEKAQILRTILESQGIETYIHNVNQIQPVISAGVRVRIKETDLPHALRILEENEWYTNIEKPKKNLVLEKRVLVPVDFSENTKKTCCLAIKHANKIGASVMIVNVYFSPHYPVGMPFDELSYTNIDNENLKANKLLQIKAEMENLLSFISNKMLCEELPKVKVEHMLKEGVPEEEILRIAEQINPQLIVMSCNKSEEKASDLVSSVNCEVIEGNECSVLSIPENCNEDNIEAYTKNIAFAISFRQPDLIAFDAFVEKTKEYNAPIYLFNVSTSNDQWNEIKLRGVKDYLSKHYPDKNITYSVLDDGDIINAIDKFVRENQISMIVLAPRKRSIISRIVSPGIVRKLLHDINIPLLTIKI